MRRLGRFRVIGARVATIGASFLLTVVVARVLDVQDAGVFFVAFTLLAVVATFGRFGIDNLALKVLGGDGPGGELRHGWWVAVTASVIGAVLLLPILLLPGLSGIDPVGAAVVAVAVIPQALAVVAGGVLRATGRLVTGVAAELGSMPALTVVGIGLVRLAGPVGLDEAFAVLAIASAATALWSVPLAVAAIRRRSSGPSVSFRSFVRTRFTSLASMMGTSLLFYVVTWAPLFALTLTGRLGDVAFFTVASRLANLVALVPAVQVSYLAPRFAELYHSGRIRDVTALARRSARQGAAVVLVPVLVLVGLGGPLIRLVYGDRLAGAAPSLAFLAIGALVSVLAGQFAQIMLICDLEHWALALAAAVVVAWAAIGIPIAGAAGATGVAIVSAVSTLLYAGSSVVVLQARRGILSTV